MDQVEAEIHPVEVEIEEGRWVQGICAECTKCGHTAESAGTGEASVKRSLALLREDCPLGEENFYVGEE